ncbi:MAG: YkgJ family cysteine cluster protein [Bryobacteraceae bacterium]
MSHIDTRDAELIQIVDTALAEAVRLSGGWLACRVGCTQCCIGPFPISQLDARRLRLGLAALAERDPGRAAGVRERARQSIGRIGSQFPGDPATGLLFEDEASENCDFAEDEPCPALDPATGACEIYSARPITCRSFGPAVRMHSDEVTSVAICELCYEGATPEEIASCQVEMDSGGLESELERELAITEGASGQTIVAFALTRDTF